MENGYKDIYQQFEKNFKEEAAPFIPEESIKSALKMEKVRFANAEKYNIPVSKVAGNSLARYTKDMLRHYQPLFFIYYILSIITEFFYCLLIWGTVKCVFLYLAGINKEAFSEKIPMSLSVIFFAAVISCNAVTQFYTRKLLYSCKGNIKRKIFVFNIACYFAAAVIIVVQALVIYLNQENYLSVDVSLFEIFIIAVAMLSISGIHNVIYSSYFTLFAAIGYAILLRKPSERDSAVAHYRELSLRGYLIRHKIPDFVYKESSGLHTEFNQWMRSKAVSLRTYGAIAFFITFILVIICLRQLVITGVSIGFTVFSVAALIITVMFFLEILSCNHVIKSCAPGQEQNLK